MTKIRIEDYFSNPKADSNRELLDAVIQYQIGMSKYDDFIKNSMWDMLDTTESELIDLVASIGEIATVTNKVSKFPRLLSLLRRLRRIRAIGHARARKFLYRQMDKWVHRAANDAKTMLEDSLVVKIDAVLPTPERLKEIVESRPFMGRTLKDWAERLETADIERIETQIKIGVTQGESIPDIKRRIVGTAKLKGKDGVTEITRRQAAALARTAVNAIGAEARRQFAFENRDIAPWQQFVATLDSRTTPICRSLDGRIFLVAPGDAPPLPDSDERKRLARGRSKQTGKVVVQHKTSKRWIDAFMSDGVDTSVPPPEVNLGRLTIQDDGSLVRSRIAEPGLFVSHHADLTSDDRIVIVVDSRKLSLSLEAENLGYVDPIEGLYGAGDAIIRGIKITPEMIAGAAVYDRQAKREDDRFGGKGRWVWKPNELSPHSSTFEISMEGKLSHSTTAGAEAGEHAPVLPLHYNERSLYVPVVDGELLETRRMKDFTQRQLLREFAKANGIKAPATRKGLPYGTKGKFDKFARQRIRELTGLAPPKTTYAEFLARMSAEKQDDILGPTRGKLFRKGGLTLDKFVNYKTGRQLTLEELEARYERAFAAAGV